MALFSRRPKKPAEPTPQPPGERDEAAIARTETGADADAGESTPSEVVEDADAGSASSPDAPAVSISVSSFGGLGVSPPAAPAEGASAAPTEGASSPVPQDDGTGKPVPPSAQPRLGTREWMRTAPAQTETMPGLRDNVLLRAALGRVGDAPPSQALLDVARQLMQGHVYLRVKGDARALLAEGKGLPLAVVNVGERTFALVYSSGAALQASLRADGDTDTSAMGQPVLTVLRHVLAGPYDGIILDPASAPSRAVLPKELLQRAVEQADPRLTVKTLLAAERTDAVTVDVVRALADAPLWVAVGTAESGARGLAEARAADGSRFLEIYSHPLEVAVMGRGDNAAPITSTQLARALRADEGLTGIVVDPAGPWLRLTRDDLAPLLAIAD